MVESITLFVLSGKQIVPLLPIGLIICFQKLLLCIDIFVSTVC